MTGRGVQSGEGADTSDIDQLASRGQVATTRRLTAARLGYHCRRLRVAWCEQFLTCRLSVDGAPTQPVAGSHRADKSAADSIAEPDDDA